jgi:hypothetical protein
MRLMYAAMRGFAALNGRLSYRGAAASSPAVLVAGCGHGLSPTPQFAIIGEDLATLPSLSVASIAS